MNPDPAFVRPLAVLGALGALAYNFLKNKRQSTPRVAEDLGKPSSSVTSTESNNYEVFLSFCGMDVRKAFVDHLYHVLHEAGICVFKDDVDLSEGEEIRASLGHAIKNSKISIPVLSRNYGSRMYCLQELVHMLECMKSDRHLVLPIFYGVKPAHVRHQIGDFGVTFSKFGEKYPEDVEKWRKALTGVSDLMVWESGKDAGSPEGELVREVTERVLRELQRFQTDLTKTFVGIDDAVEDILRLLDSNPSATQIVVIYGMLGIGKTTVANAVYSRLSSQFRDRSVLVDIRDSFSQNEGKLLLQSRLISDLLKPSPQVSNTWDARSIMEKRFQHKKALIILDGVEDKKDLDDLFQKEWFAEGSKVIITTRNSSVLVNVEERHRYKLQRISAGESLTMFSRHAFGTDSPPPRFVTLARDVVATTEGLPLALSVVGSSLHGQGEEYWKELLEELKRYPSEDVESKLKVSYQALSEHQKEIFLDIACFLIGMDSRIAHYMWKSRGFIPRKEIRLLNSRSLIETGDNHELKMHGQLRDLGRKIAGEGAPMQRRRLWAYDKALEVLQQNKENKNVEALHLDKEGSSKFMEQKGFLPNLNFLHGREVEFAGDFKDSLPELRWIKWERCPESFTATNVHLEKLLILDLSGGYISHEWRGWTLIKMEGLKVLNLSGCSDLKSTPDLSSFKRLERLVLENCEDLEEIHPSIRYVEHLVSLNLRHCGSLEVLPAEVGELKELKELVLDETNIQEIPPCVESLEELEMLSAVGCHQLTRVCGSMSSLVRLSSLNLSTCKKLKTLPDSLVDLGELQRLSLACCYLLEQIPTSIGKLGKLVELDLSSTRIKELPPSIGELNKLEILRVSNSRIETLPSTIGQLKSLQELDASGCHQLKGEILLDKGGLSCLSTLRLGSAKISRLLESSREEASLLELHDLSALQNLDLLYCWELQSLPKPPSHLSSLQLTCRNHELLSLSRLSYLKKLTLHTCMSLQIIPDLPSCIRKLRICKCPNLKRLSVLPKWNSLLELELLQCYGLRELDGLEALTSLRKLDVSTSTELSNLENFEDLEPLRYSDIQSYDEKADHLHEIRGLDGLKSLKVLNISGRKHIRQLDLSQSEQLKQLIVNNCEDLDKIDFHTSIKSLERFDTDGCKEHIPDSLAHNRT